MTSQHFVLSLKDEQGALHFPLMRPRCPQNIWKVCVCVCVCVHARSHSCLLCLCMRVMCIGVGVLLVSCTLSLTPILPITPGISCPEAMCQTSLATASITACSLSSQHHIGNISRTAALTDYLFLFISAGALIGVDLGFVYTSAPSVDPAGLRVGPQLTCG